MSKKEKTIYDLKLHEQIKIDGVFEYYIIRVPSGWLYQCLNPSNHTMTSMFVPFDDKFMKSKPNRKKVILKKSLCCDAEMTSGGQCLNCGANGNIDQEVHNMEILTRKEHNKRHEKLPNKL